MEIILTVIVIFFFLVFLSSCWTLTNRPEPPDDGERNIERDIRRHFNREPSIPNLPSITVTVTVTHGLDASVHRSLPVFTYSSKTHPDSSLECSICLSEFEENQLGRVLPKCNHSFHLNCIDMWFHSHSTCPTCRQHVELGPSPPEIPAEVVLPITEPYSTSELFQHEQEQVVTSSSVGDGRKPMELDVPKTNIKDEKD